MAQPAVASDGIYSATYSGIPVYEFLYGPDLKESVMRRRLDDWINATHILKAAGFDKPSRTRILEREVQKDTHEKIQGGYGKYQGTWIPLENGKTLAIRNNTYDKLAPIFEYVAGEKPPPPAPRHTSKPKQPKRPAVPKWKPTNTVSNPPQIAPHPAPDNLAAMVSAAAAAAVLVNAPGGISKSVIAPPDMMVDAADAAHGDSARRDGAAASAQPMTYVNDGSRIESLAPPSSTNTSGSASGSASTGATQQQQQQQQQRKRKRDDSLETIRQQHAVYGDELLDYFLLSRDEKTGRTARPPDPPLNFKADYTIDTDENTALHWACAMGDVEVIKELKRHGASLDAKNSRGETPFMRSVTFTNCYERETFPAVMKELWDTVNMRDGSGASVVHHAATLRNDRVTGQSCSRYYLEHILNKLQETHDPAFVQQLLDAQDLDGNTAIHLAAKRNARKCIRSLIGRNASMDIPNNDGITGEEMIVELNARSKDKERMPQRSSSPFGPDGGQSGTGWSGGGGVSEGKSGASKKLGGATYQSAAAKTVHSSITPLVFEKLQSLASNFEEEWMEMDQAEKEARQILANAQTETNMVNQEIQVLEAQLEPDAVASKVAEEAASVRLDLLDLVRHRNAAQVQTTVDAELSRLVAGEARGAGARAERERLAGVLAVTIREAAQAEADYVDALSMVGTGEKIEKYRRLLRKCLDGHSAVMLDECIDDLIEMMEEDEQVGGTAVGVESERMDGERMEMARA